MFYYRRIILIPLLLLLIFGGASYNKSVEVPYYIGESMHYRLKYGLLNIGIASISCIEDSAMCTGQIRAEARSSGWVRIFKNLDYCFECIMDITTGLPNSAKIKLKDGKVNTNSILIFDQNSRSDSTIIFCDISGKHIVQKNIYDILSGFYHFRENSIYENSNKKEDIVVKTFFMGEIWDLRIRYTGEEIVNTKCGKLTCDKYSPVTIIGRYFDSDDDMSIWFTQDEIPIPVKIRLNLKLGSIQSELVEYQKPKNRSSKSCFSPF
jgi:hypothetical protein